MPSPSFFLRSSTTLVSCLSLLSSTIAGGIPSSASYYSLDTSYSGDTFYSGWDFFSQADPTHGFVTYLNESAAQAAGLLRRGTLGSNIIGVDSTNQYAYNVSYWGVNGLGRPSVRISTQKTWNHGLFIADIAHMPGGVCGTWPAFWTLGDGPWPYHGEIDILEGANNQQNTLTSLHVAGVCSIAGSDETGALQASNCTYDTVTGANSGGCGVSDNSTQSFGLGFNANGGGVYAMEWTSQAIKVWFWPRALIPWDVRSGRPDPSRWGLPDANMAGNCSIDANFQNHKMIFDNTFCGDWAGNTWGSTGCQAATGVSTCAQYVGQNPAAFADMYWDINSVNVYTTASGSLPTATTYSWPAGHTPHPLQEITGWPMGRPVHALPAPPGKVGLRKRTAPTAQTLKPWYANPLTSSSPSATSKASGNSASQPTMAIPHAVDPAQQPFLDNDLKQAWPTPASWIEEQRSSSSRSSSVASAHAQTTSAMLLSGLSPAAASKYSALPAPSWMVSDGGRGYRHRHRHD